MPARIEAVLRRKGQVILYGPPGTGKTHWALMAAQELASRKAFGRSLAQLNVAERSIIGPGSADDTLVRLCSFHPGYSYEDFIEGYRPLAQDGRLIFELRDGIFKRLCTTAEGRRERNFYLVIDEFNRADVPRVFGELLTSVEVDKRMVAIHLPLSGTALRVPTNLFIIGTMNTADRSISLLDAALRRRFGFIELMPDYGTLGAAMVGRLSLAAWLQALNLRLIKVLRRDARNLQIGHAYLLDGGRPLDSMARLAAALRDDLIPLLEEYCYENFEALAEILTGGLVDASQQRVRDELFAPERETELLEVLETMFTQLGVVTSAAAAEAVVGEAEVGETVDDGDDVPAR